MMFKNLFILALFLCLNFSYADTAAKKTKKRLQIVFMFGQSEMVGQAKVSGAFYMLQPPAVPPRDITLNAHKGLIHQINAAYLYWRAMEAYDGPADKKKKLLQLTVERSKFRPQFKKQVLDSMKKDGNFRGKKYQRGFGLFNLVDLEAEAVGITPKMRAIFDAKDNKFSLENAYDQIITNSKTRYQKQLEVNKILLNNSSLEGFTKFNEALKPVPKTREAYAKLAETHLHMPIAKKTHIYSFAADTDKATQGRLSVGYGASIDTIGMEYATGMTLESKIDGPILIVKCIVNKGGIADLDFSKIMPKIKTLLDDPKKYHPDYDPQAGYDLAGLIWFQGLSDKKNAEYATQLKSMIGDFRKLVKTPKLPIVCVAVGDMLFQNQSDDSLVNKGMREMANMPEFKSTVDVLETYKYFPAELAVLHGLFYKNKMKGNSPENKRLRDVVYQATGMKGRRSPPYLGSTSFYLLSGHEAALSLVKLNGFSKK
jgi:hypothetical protein